LTEAQKLWREVTDFGLIFFNWARGYRNLLTSKGEADYSCLYDFATEVVEQAFPFISRLRSMPDYEPAMDDYIRHVLNQATDKILQDCLQYEDLMRLGGTWNDDEQEYKEYWLKRLGFTNNLLGTAGTTQKQIECTKR
jgi:hypothetical protein